MTTLHEEEDLFDARYPPDTTLPPSDEYDHEDGQVGYYGRSEHDLAIVQAANPKCVWSTVEGDTGLFMRSGFAVVSWMHWYISSVPRPDVEDDFEEYQLTVDEEEADDET